MKILGEKLKTARILAGYSLTELAEELGITKQSLSQYENGVEPRADIYLKIIKILNCQNDFLITPLIKNTKIKNSFFRATAAADAIERKNQEIKANLVVNIYRVLLDYLELPKLNLPVFNESDSIEDKAYKLRNYWGIGSKPIKNMIELLEENGIIVSSFSSGGRLSYKIDGYTQQLSSLDNSDENTFCVIVENNKESWARKNFSLAHELGHIVLHSSENYLELSKPEQNQLENEANIFASSFLLPKESFVKDVTSVRSIQDLIPLKSKWFVSIGAMMIRAKQLHVFTEETYLRFIKNYSYHRYKQKEPLDDQIPILKPALFQSCIEILFENGVSLEQFQSDLSYSGIGLDLKYIENLLSLEDGFFDKYKETSKNVIIKFKNN